MIVGMLTLREPELNAFSECERRADFALDGSSMVVQGKHQRIEPSISLRKPYDTTSPRRIATWSGEVDTIVCQSASNSS
jgi:hypothetical protein